MGEKQKMWVGGIRGRDSIFQIFDGIRKEDYKCVMVHNMGKAKASSWKRKG
jgi:hypothetical protein